MVNVSKQEAPKEVSQYLQDQLVDLFVASTSRREVAHTLSEFLSPAERIMFAKRIGIVVLLVHEYSSYDIRNIFKVGMGTVLRMQKLLDDGKLKHIQAVLKRKKARESFIGIVESALTFGLPGNPQKRLRLKTRAAIESWRVGGK